RDGQVVGEGWHRAAGTPHAEAHALAEAGERARGATLYVTLEPCCHHGRTPPCAPQVIAAGVARVVVGMRDPNPRVDGGGLRELEAAGVPVELVDDAACQEVNRPFVKAIKSGLPWVTIKYAMTLDGKIATRTGHSQWISGELSRSRVHQERNLSDAVMVGVGTILQDNPRLTARLPDARNPLRVVVDSHGRTPPHAHVLDGEAPTLLVTTAAPVSAGPAEVLSAPAGPGGVDLRWLLQALAQRGVHRMLVEGGGRLHASLLRERLVDHVMAFVAPVLIGGEAAATPVEGEGVATIGEGVRLTAVKWHALESDLLIEGDTS
ncbi:MAG: bifunctional diaminohydroxyphosphoribosylaminopyrimidine deaminase/5-amino-6-(5-phosphoribosylamino)uracil reductase RibD, partial [Candidatus Xenobia bacterium]